MKIIEYNSVCTCSNRRKADKLYVWHVIVNGVDDSYEIGDYIVSVVADV